MTRCSIFIYDFYSMILHAKKQYNNITKIEMELHGFLLFKNKVLVGVQGAEANGINTFTV